jgi:SAM-dependent methyltransferase
LGVQLGRDPFQGVVVPVTTAHPDAQELDYTIYYRNWHDDSPEHARKMANWTAGLIRPYLPPAHELPAIDIGCGMGFALLALKQLGFTDVRGIDLDAGQIAVAKSHGLDAEKVCDSAEYLRLHPNTFSTVLLMDVLEHVPVGEQVPLLRTIHEAMQPGGRLLVQTPNANSILAARWRYNDFTHSSSFTEHSIRFVLLNSGFTSVEVPVNSPARRPSLRLWRAEARRNFGRDLRRFMIDRVWRAVLRSELGDFDEVERIPTTLNLLAVATKDA